MKHRASHVPISPEPVVGVSPDYLPAYLSNGVIGLRVRDVPLRPGVATVSGLEGVHPEARVACVPQAPYPLAGDIQLGSVWLSSLWQSVHDVEQRYDFATGELHSHFEFGYEGFGGSVDVVTFCCRSHPYLVAQETTSTVLSACDVSVAAGIDPTGVPGRWLERRTSVPGIDADDVDGSMLWETLGAMASCGTAYWTEFSPRGDVDRLRAANKEIRR